jgi:hypothetical protein
LLEGAASAYDIDWAIQNSRVVEQAMDLRNASSTYRDPVDFTVADGAAPAARSKTAGTEDRMRIARDL